MTNQTGSICRCCGDTDEERLRACFATCCSLKSCGLLRGLVSLSSLKPILVSSIDSNFSSKRRTDIARYNSHFPLQIQLVSQTAVAPHISTPGLPLTKLTEARSVILRFLQEREFEAWLEDGGLREAGEAEQRVCYVLPQAGRRPFAKEVLVDKSCRLAWNILAIRFVHFFTTSP